MKKLLLFIFKIFIIIRKNVIIPYTDSNEFIALFMESKRLLNIFMSFILLFKSFKFVIRLLFFIIGFLLNLFNSIPIKIFPNIWDNSIYIPIFLLFRKRIPTVFIINRGFEKYVYNKIFLPSLILRVLFSIRSFIYFAFEKDPDNSDIIKIKLASPGDENSLLNVLEKIVLKNWGNFISINIDDIINMGNSDGNILFINSFDDVITVPFIIMELLNTKYVIIKMMTISVNEYKIFFIIYFLSCYNYIREI